MANSLLVQLSPNDDVRTRKACIQQWCEAVAVAARAFRGVAPASGNNYLIDSGLNEDRPTPGIADVAWLSQASS
jgi:hypothetical protein